MKVADIVQDDEDRGAEGSATTHENPPPTDVGDKEVNALSKYEMLAAQLGDDAGPDLNVNNQKAQLKLEKAAKEFIVKEELQPGATVRPGIDLNQHFNSSIKQPWPHKDIYQDAKLELDFTVLDPAALAKYEEDYGSSKNAYLRGESLPKKITNIFRRYGDALPIIHTRLFEDTEVHRRNMCAILAIYTSDECMGGNVPHQSS